MPYDFVVIVPSFTFVTEEGKCATPSYLRPVTDRGLDFINAAYGMHKRGLGGSLVFDTPDALHDAMDALSQLGLKVEVL